MSGKHDTTRPAIDWSRPIQFANGEPLELMEIMDDGRHRVFRSQAECIEASVWDVAADGRAAPDLLADRMNMRVVNRDD